MNSGRPEILFATISAGGGHVATARAMAEAIESYYPGEFELRVSDYMKAVGVTGLDRRHKNSWRRALRYPFLARTGQRLIDAFPKPAIAAQRRILRNFARAAAGDLNQNPPRLVVSNHGLVTTGLAEARRLYGLKTPVLTFATEPHNISAYWAEPRADHIITPSEEVRRDLLRLGVPAKKLEVVGYPVRRAFLDPPSKKEARESLGLGDRFTCLVAFGGEGVGGNQKRLVETLLNSDVSPRVIAATGRNEVLARGLRKLPAGKERLRVLGFVEDVAPYLAAADVFVGKAGPASVYEALAVGRPVLLTGYAGLNERGVLHFVLREELGSYVKDLGALSQEVGRYANTLGLSEGISSRSRNLDLGYATERLARYVVRYARSRGE